MSVVINTNFAATLAANNLAASSQSLQRSLNRLSSGSKIVNPSDDAGGLAVSMKLSAAAHRSGAAASNIGNAVSFLQTQDGVLKTAGKVLDRIGELKTLSLDPTKNSTDIANYDAEFTQLKAELTSLGGEKFNGIALFGSATISVAATADAESASAIDIGGAVLLSTGSSLTDNFANLSNWNDVSTGGGTAVASGNQLTLTKNGGLAKVTSLQTFSGAFTIDYDTTGDVLVGMGGSGLLESGVGGSTHFHIALDGTGQYTIYQNGSMIFGGPLSGAPTSASAVYFSNGVGGSTGTVSNVSISGMQSTNAGSVATASSLAALSVATIKSSLADVATLRATNGAQQSRLGFAAEVLTVNKANLEAANSRITDVDVAEESTQLARFNILVQAGTAMLTQANQSAQSALRLIQG